MLSCVNTSQCRSMFVLRVVHLFVACTNFVAHKLWWHVPFDRLGADEFLSEVWFGRQGMQVRAIAQMTFRLGQDSHLTDIYTNARHVRLADGPDIVHLNTIAKEELKKKTSVMGAMVSGTNHNIEKYGKFRHVVANTKARL